MPKGIGYTKKDLLKVLEENKKNKLNGKKKSKTKKMLLKGRRKRNKKV